MRTVLILPLLFLTVCNKNTPENINPITPESSNHEFQGKSVNLEHTRYFPVSSTSKESRNTEFLEQIDFIPLYIGQERSSVKIRPEGDYHTQYFPDWYYGPETPDVSVFVDTTQTLSNVYQWEFDQSIGQYRTKAVLPNHQWYPVYIYSSDPDTVSIGYNSGLELFLEALDKDGQWSAIHHPGPVGCGVGKYQIVLPPNQYAITSVPKYDGEFKTKARLKLYEYANTYSNEFAIQINESQFTPQPGNEFALNLIDWIFYRR